MAFKMVAVDMDWTILDLEKRIPMEVFEGFKGSLWPGATCSLPQDGGWRALPRCFRRTTIHWGEMGILTHSQSPANFSICKTGNTLPTKCGRQRGEMVGGVAPAYKGNYGCDRSETGRN